MVVVMVIKTDKATSPPANKAKRFEADPGSEVRIFDYWIDSKSTQNSQITCFVDVFCSVICLLWKPSNGDTMLVFAWFRATRNWISPPNLFLRLLCVWSQGFLAPGPGCAWFFWDRYWFICIGNDPRVMYALVGVWDRFQVPSVSKQMDN